MSNQSPVFLCALVTSALGLLLATACGDDADSAMYKADGATPNGGVAGKGGAGAGGKTASGGAAPGGSASSGSSSNSGTSSGGAAASGGTSSGGAVAGGMSSGGASNGGRAHAGEAEGGAAASGGTASGGTASGGTASGGTASGGTASGGAGGTGGGGSQCAAMGWATRASRTGGAFAISGGGDATPIVVKTFAELQSAASGTSAKVIHIDGTLGSGWSDRSGDRLEIGSNKTVVGLRPGTQLKAALHINDSSNVIVRNIVINGPGSNDKQAWDNLSIEGTSKNVWIDHCEFWDGQDGNADTVKGADTVTYSWNIFGYKMANPHNLSNLIASSDDEPVSEGKLDITFIFNHFRGVAQRAPRCRYGNVHVVNNLFTRDGMQSDYSISAGKDCKVLTENNHFFDVNNPIYANHASGSAGNEVRGNKFESTSGDQTGFGTAFTPPYDYASLLVPASEVRALVQAKAGATLSSPSACD